jgi:hypothetical protein
MFNNITVFSYIFCSFMSFDAFLILIEIEYQNQMCWIDIFEETVPK